MGGEVAGNFIHPCVQDNEDVVLELRNLHEKEKGLLLEENKTLSGDLERNLELNSRLQADRRHLEEEYTELQVRI